MRVKIAVLIAAYRPTRALTRAIQSALLTALPVEVIVVDDGNTESLAPLLPPDSRVTLLRLPTNQGLAAALNHGLAHIFSGDFTHFARLDADDRCEPMRFEKQLQWLSGHPDQAMCGCDVAFVDEETDVLLWTFRGPRTAAAAAKYIRYNAPLLHPAWFMSVETARLLAPYQSNHPAAEDYDWLWRAHQQGLGLGNVPEVLVTVTDTRGGISSRRRHQQLLDRLRLQLKYFSLTNPHAYLGLAKTLLLWLLPRNWLRELKKRLIPRSRV